MTSAYKMDERKNPLEVVAVPSDRFYDEVSLHAETSVIMNYVLLTLNYEL